MDSDCTSGYIAIWFSFWTDYQYLGRLLLIKNGLSLKPNLIKIVLSYDIVARNVNEISLFQVVEKIPNGPQNTCVVFDDSFKIRINFPSP